MLRIKLLLAFFKCISEFMSFFKGHSLQASCQRDT